LPVGTKAVTQKNVTPYSNAVRIERAPAARLTGLCRIFECAVRAFEIASYLRVKELYLAFSPEAVPQEHVSRDLHAIRVESHSRRVNKTAILTVEVATDVRASQSDLSIGMKSVAEADAAFYLNTLCVQGYSGRVRKKAVVTSKIDSNLCCGKPHLAVCSEAVTE
jgi:hypothetical protein